MESNKTILQLHSLLKQFGINKIVFSAGSRHLPLIHSIEQDDYFETYRVVDERSGAFFALGLIQETGKPVAVCCTSGTACINFASAVIEAYYQRLPLLVISADRMIEYLNQNEDQLYDQIKSFEGFTKYQAKLPRIDSEVDEWYTNRLINEALIELTHHGNGPVHIDFPIENPFAEVFELKDIPFVRKISLLTADCTDAELKKYANMLQGKKVAIVWGQSVWKTSKLAEAVSLFVKTFDVVILTDYISNCRYEHALNNTTRILQTKFKSGEKENLLPDIIISVGGNYIFNGELKGFLNGTNVVHWQVGKEDKVIDGFKKLTTVFEMNEENFFLKISENASFKNNSGYYELWKRMDNEIPEPDSDKFDELKVIRSLIKNMPDNSALHVANSWSIRMSQLINIPDSVRVFCNRGANGIDGSMSTAVGFASSNEQLTFLLIGDLSFFYDMNSLWIKHLSSKMRILLINNHGGSMLFKPFMKELMDRYPMSNLGIGRDISAKGWVESVGIEYYSARNISELDKCIDLLIREESDNPILVEAFTDYFSDANSYYNNTGYERREFSDKVMGKLGHIAKKIRG